jgi:hypothetical protein
MIRRSRSVGAVRRLHHDARGATLTELLVGTIIGAMVMSVVATSIFTTNDLRKRADDRSQFAGDVSITSLSFDRDGMMATTGAPAKSQASSVSCAPPSTRVPGGWRLGPLCDRRRKPSGRSVPARERRRDATMLSNVSSCSW